MADLPAIDLLLITHDHWDHLDHATVSALQGSVGQALVPLGVGAHLQHWGYTPQQIQELDWYDSQGVAPGFTVHLVPARHDSGRTLTRYQSLWGGYVLESSKKRLLFSGDTGYGPHFRQIAERFDRFDLVALDMGQYDPRWPYIHMTPQQAAQAVEELNAEALLPSHIGRFNLARHRWTAPLEQIVAASAGRPYQLVTPQIGEPLTLDHAPDAPEARYTHWWQAVPLTEPRLSAR